MPVGNEKNTEYINELVNKLQELLVVGHQNTERVILTKEAPRFHYSISSKMYLEIKTGAELYVLKDRGEKEGKYYIFSPWSWGSGQIFLILKEHVVKLEDN